MKNKDLVLEPPKNAKEFDKLPIKNTFLIIKKPMIVYKRLADDKRATLLLPVGTIIYTGGNWNGNKKLRASGAIVLKIMESVRQYSFEFHSWKIINRRKVKCGCSWWDLTFKYEVGNYVFPTKPFSFKKETCNSGIHFYIRKSHCK